MLAIGLTGLARSGKDTVADYLAERYGFTKFVQSEVAAEELLREGKEDTKMNRSLKTAELREKFGNDILVRRSLERAKKEGCEKAVFAGLHALQEVEFLKKNCGQFILIAVRAEKGERFARRTKLDAQSEKEFFKRDKHDVQEFELGKVIASADSTIENNSTINDLHRAIDELMHKL